MYGYIVLYYIKLPYPHHYRIPTITRVKETFVIRGSTRRAHSSVTTGVEKKRIIRSLGLDGEILETFTLGGFLSLKQPEGTAKLCRLDEMSSIADDELFCMQQMIVLMHNFC